ncbi:hypothetical protein J6590_069124 [Homalodisca vitripennis]|nr:hypothetical protein J6590_069124 [Homalodisca vitripennis]
MADDELAAPDAPAVDDAPPADAPENPDAGDADADQPPPPPEEEKKEPEETPPAEGPEEPKINIEGLNKIVGESNEIVVKHQAHINEQKKTLSTMVFVLNRITATLMMYRDHIDRLNAFLYHNELKQTEWYIRYWRELPVYGDFMEVFPEAPDAMEQKDVPHPLPKATLEQLCQDVVNNMYGGGMIVKTQKSLGKDIHRRMELRDHTVMEQLMSMEPWFDLFSAEMSNESALEGKVDELASLLGFVTTGVLGASEPLKLDLRKAAEEEW